MDLNTRYRITLGAIGWLARFVICWLAVCLPAAEVSAQTANVRETAPPVTAWELRGGRVTLQTDFDGDQLQDEATGSPTNGSYLIEIRFGRGADSAPVQLQAADSGLMLVANDLDLDLDLDLIAFDPLSLRPAALWINDGEGHFDRVVLPSIYSDSSLPQLRLGIDGTAPTMVSARYSIDSTLARAKLVTEFPASDGPLPDACHFPRARSLSAGILHRGPPLHNTSSVS